MEAIEIIIILLPRKGFNTTEQEMIKDSKIYIEDQMDKINKFSPKYIVSHARYQLVNWIEGEE